VTSEQPQVTESKLEKISASSSSSTFIKLTGELANKDISDYSTEEFNCIKSVISSRDTSETDTTAIGDDFEKS